NLFILHHPDSAPSSSPLFAEACRQRPALQAQARKASLPVEIHADGIGRYPQDIEAAVYFCTLEALQNTAKYAGASRAAVGLSCSGGSLRFTVTPPPGLASGPLRCSRPAAGSAADRAAGWVGEVTLQALRGQDRGHRRECDGQVMRRVSWPVVGIGRILSPRSVAEFRQRVGLGHGGAGTGGCGCFAA